MSMHNPAHPGEILKQLVLSPWGCRSLRQLVVWA